MKEVQEWQLINNPEFGLLKSAVGWMRAHTRSGRPTPDGMDELLLARVEEAGVLPGPPARHLGVRGASARSEASRRRRCRCSAARSSPGGASRSCPATSSKSRTATADPGQGHDQHSPGPRRRGRAGRRRPPPDRDSRGNHAGRLGTPHGDQPEGHRDLSADALTPPAPSSWTMPSACSKTWRSATTPTTRGRAMSDQDFRLPIADFGLPIEDPKSEDR